jgi:KTSC domain-containing protein
MARLIRTRLESSSIASITYDPEDGLLEVEFRRTGHLYDYFDVPRATYRALMEAESKGAFLNRIIKPIFDHARVDFPLG